MNDIAITEIAEVFALPEQAVPMWRNNARQWQRDQEAAQAAYSGRRRQHTIAALESIEAGHKAAAERCKADGYDPSDTASAAVWRRQIEQELSDADPR